MFYEFILLLFIYFLCLSDEQFVGMCASVCDAVDNFSATAATTTTAIV